MPLEKRLFTTGMDGDSEQRIVEPTSYRYALNIRSMSADGSSVGAIENTKGNTLVSYSLPSGSNRVLGSVEDKKRNKVYYFVWNNANNHSILEFDAPSNTIQLVLQNTLLNFDYEHLITGVNLVELDETNHLLYWTDDFNEPRKINIEKGILHSAGDFVNGYSNPFEEKFIYRIKEPPPCEPICAYGTDTSKNINLLSRKLFQFKSAFIYDDYEKSATSPISKVPLPVSICSSNASSNTNNKIDITVETGSSIVTKIQIYSREGNEGDFVQIEELDKSLLNIGDNTTYIYSFYNDKVYNTIDINESIKLFDNVPLKSKAQEIIEGDRITDGNILEGFNPITVDAKLNLSFTQDPSPQLFGFKGRIYIGNFFNNNNNYIFGQPIHDPTGTGNSPVFGGAGVAQFVGGLDGSYKQSIPLGGFVAYLVGTPYYAISTQSHPGNIVYAGDPSKNIYDSSSSSKRNKIRNAINANQVYSEFTFTGVPKGLYTMRFASHLITQAELSASDLSWQRTSTNSICVAGDKNYECKIEIQANGNIIVANYPAVANGGTINTSMIMDLTDPRLGAGSEGIVGYVTDKDVSSPSSLSDYLSDTRIELAKVNFTGTGAFNNNWNNPMAAASIAQGSAVSIGSVDYINGRTFTDHNGYFYIVDSFVAFSGQNIQISSVFSSIYNTNIAQFNYANPPTSPFVYPTGAGVSMGIFRNTDASGNVQNYARTKLTGTINYNGVGISGVGVYSSRGGGVDTTDPNGDYDFYVYVDTRNSPSVSPVRTDEIYYSISDNCIVEFDSSNGQDYNIVIIPGAIGGILISPYTGTYNNAPTTPFYVLVANANILSILGSGSSIALKRGSVQQFGIVYYDHANRSGLTNTNDFVYTSQDPQGRFGLKLEIPFFTEVNPVASGAVYGGSQPIVTWEIKNLPPDWATHYQWVRTLNGVPNRYLQFTAKDVIYTNDERSPVSFALATKMGINIQNIVNYKTINTDSLVAYVPEPGDRVRFIKNANGNFFNQYIDLVVRDIDPAGFIYLDNIVAIGQQSAGFLFEIYTPKLKSSNQIYYEFGQCYEIGDSGLPTRYHKQGSSNTTFTAQNQDPNNPSVTPATGVFLGGDTYSRIRSIPFGGNNTAFCTNPPKPWFVEDASFSDFFKSKVQDIGRPNKVDNTFRQTRRKSTIYYSEKFIPETKINGLSSVFDTSFETYEAQYGGIQKLYNEDLRLDCYQELKVGAIPINQVEFQSSDISGSSVVGSSANVLNPIRYYQGEYGIALNPESFAQYGGARYFFDVNRGAVLRLSADGLTPISDYKNRIFFLNKSKDLLAFGLKTNIFGIFDAKFGEYVLAFERFSSPTIRPINTPPDAETIAFNEKYNSWSTFYSYLPEGLCTSGVNIVSFSGGSLYTHNSNALYNNFYGVQYSAEAWPICNGESSKNKALQAISQECSEAWEAYDITTENGQSTNLVVSDFEEKQNMQYAGVLRDANTPNIANPIFEGDEMVDTSFLIKLRNSSTAYVKMFAVNMYWQPQERSNK